MIKDFLTLASLYRKGKIHRELLIRLAVLAGLAIVTGTTAIVNIFKGLSIEPAIIFFLLGFFSGLLFFSRINRIEWDEQKEILKVQRFDIVSISIFAIYIGVRLYAKYFVEIFYHNLFAISGFSIILVSGIIIGRLFGTVRAIKKINRGKTQDRISA